MYIVISMAESEVIQTSKVSTLLTASLGRSILNNLGAGPGDYVCFYRDPDGRIYIDKVRPPTREPRSQ